MSRYIANITTWENDADDYKTQVVKCDSYEEAIFIENLAKKFTSRSRGYVPNYPGTDIDDVRGYGNEEHSIEELACLIFSVIEKYGYDDMENKYNNLIEIVSSIQIEDEPEYDNYEGVIIDFLYDVLGVPASEFYLYDCTNFCRVYDSSEIIKIDDSDNDNNNKSKDSMREVVLYIGTNSFRSSIEIRVFDRQEYENEYEKDESYYDDNPSEIIQKLDCLGTSYNIFGIISIINDNNFKICSEIHYHLYY